MIAVDASVAVKWLWPEPGHAEARKLLKDGRKLLAPSHVRIEVAGAILRRYREKKISEPEAQHLLASWGRMLQLEILHLIPIEELYDMAVAISLVARHGLADCLYVAVGQDLDVPLITADETLQRRCKSVYGKVELLMVSLSH
jgi:predicted nucleic acid-binding protein